MQQVLQIPVFPVRVHAFVGVADSPQTLAAEGNLATLVLGVACPSLLPLGGFPILFGGQANDLIVSTKSQKVDGLSFDPKLPIPFEAQTVIPISVIHSIIPFVLDVGPDVLSEDFLGFHIVGVQTGIPTLIIDQLNQPITSTSFATIVP